MFSGHLDFYSNGGSHQPNCSSVRKGKNNLFDDAIDATADAMYEISEQIEETAVEVVAEMDDMAVNAVEVLKKKLEEVLKTIDEIYDFLLKKLINDARKLLTKILTGITDDVFQIRMRYIVAKGKSIIQND